MRKILVVKHPRALAEPACDPAIRARSIPVDQDSRSNGGSPLAISNGLRLSSLTQGWGTAAKRCVFRLPVAGSVSHPADVATSPDSALTPSRLLSINDKCDDQMPIQLAALSRRADASTPVRHMHGPLVPKAGLKSQRDRCARELRRSPRLVSCDTALRGTPSITYSTLLWPQSEQCRETQTTGVYVDPSVSRETSLTGAHFNIFCLAACFN